MVSWVASSSAGSTLIVVILADVCANPRRLNVWCSQDGRHRNAERAGADVRADGHARLGEQAVLYLGQPLPQLLGDSGDAFIVAELGHGDVHRSPGRLGDREVDQLG